MKIKSDVGKHKWHRIFGWCKVKTPYAPNGGCLVDSEYKHVRQYVMGKGWVDYKGRNGGNITSVFVHRHELFDEPINDKNQALIKCIVKIFA